MFHKIIKELCDELKIKYTLLSKDWIFMLEKEGITKFISGYKFDITEHGLGELLDDKYAMYDVLSSKNIPVINYNIVYSQNNKLDYAQGCNSIEYLKELFERYNQSVVLKINDGSCGVDVYYISNFETLVNKYEQLIQKHHSLSVCPFYDIENEYRAIIFEGEAKLLYKKIKPVITGDGKKTIKELLISFNPKYFNSYNEKNKDVILQKGEVYEYDWRFNLSRGAISSTEILKNDRIEIDKILEKISKNIKIDFCSVDIIKTIDNKFLVMEINSGVMMENFIKQHENGYQKAKEIYKLALEKMFS